MTSEEYAPGNDRVVAKESCPKCGSRDNLVRYADGHAHCFTPDCGHWEPATGAAPASDRRHRADTHGGELLEPGPDGFRDLAKRKLRSETLRRWGYFVTTYNGQDAQVASYRDQTGKVVAQKLRFSSKDSMPILKGEAYPGKLTHCELFGAHLWGGRDRSIVIVEGELDALSVDQAMNGKQPVVSVGTGAGGAAEHIKRHLLRLMEFDTVILWFDQDEAGQKAVQECVTLFPPGRVKIAQPPTGFKDASDLLQAGRPGDITAAVFGATAWSPPGILTAAEVLERVDFDAPPKRKFSTPWPAFNEATFGGIAEQDVVFILSGAGKGKSTFLFELISHLESVEKVPVGALFFEDTLSDVVNGVLTVRTSKRLRLDQSLAPAEERRAEWSRVANDNRLFLFDGENARWDLKDLLNYIRFLAKGCGAKVIMVDPLSFLVAQSQEKDERRTLDVVTSELAALAKQLSVCLVITHHLSRPEGNKGHEEGAEISLKQARGSNAIGMFATLALGLQWHPDEEVTEVRCLKSRWQGELNGKALAWLRYDADTGRIVETSEPTGDGGADVGVSDFDYH